MASALKEKVWSIMEATRTSIRRFRGGADHRRWGNPAALLDPDWESRTRRIAQLVPPNSSVLEFGAARMTLRKYLPPGCTYTPTDLVDRGSGTIVCDLNARELPGFPPHDVAVFSGVLEYIVELPRLVSHVSNSINRIIASYCCVVPEEGRGIVARRSHGWVNDYTSPEIEEIFFRAGFRCEQVESFHSQKIYLFVKAHAPDRLL